MLQTLIKSNPFKKAEPSKPAFEAGLREKSKGDARVAVSKKESVHSSFSVGVLGAKGGAGASLLALNLALALARNGKKSALLDANLQQADIAVMLGKQPDHSVSELAKRHRDFDASMIEACSVTISAAGNSRCLLLSGPADGEAALQTNLSELAHSISSIKSTSDFVVVDLPKLLDKHLVTMLDELDHILVVFEASVTGIAGAKRWQKIFSELAYDTSKISFVQNRQGARGQNCQSDIHSLLGQKPIVQVPNVFLFSEECTMLGEPAVLRNKHNKYCRSILALAEKLAEKRLSFQVQE